MTNKLSETFVTIFQGSFSSSRWIEFNLMSILYSIVY
jgi:hypothetical protein